MLDLVKAKYEPKRPVEMHEQHDEEEDIICRSPEPEARHQEIPPNHALLLLNLVMFMCAISLIVYGAIHMNDCPAQKMIAVSYIVMGGIFFLSRALNSRHDLREALGGRNIGPKPKLLILVTLILQLVMLGWFVATCYWVYHIESYIDKKDPKSPNYCSEDYYKNVFWGSTIALAVVGLILLLACCGCCYLIRNRPDDD